jgi:hypothetical protein
MIEEKKWKKANVINTLDEERRYVFLSFSITIVLSLSLLPN